MTEVSSRPRTGRSLSGTRGDGRVGDVVEVAAETVVVNGGRGAEQLDGSLGADEATSAEWGQFADRFTVSGHDEGLTLDKGAHDATAVVPKLSLADLTAHG